MKSKLKTGLAVLSLFCAGSTTFAQSVAADEKPTIEVVKPPQTPKYRAKALFKYPNPNPVSIVVFTQQDLEKIKQDRFLHDLKNATLTRKPASHSSPILND